MNNLLENLKVTLQPTENSTKIFGKHFSLSEPFSGDNIKTILDFIGKHLNLNVKYFSVSTLKHLFTTDSNTQKFMVLLTMLKSSTRFAFKVIDHGDDQFEIMYNDFDFSTIVLQDLSGKIVESQDFEKAEEIVEPTTEPIIEEIVEPELLDSDFIPELEKENEITIESINGQPNVAVIENENIAEIEEKVDKVNIPKVKKTK